MSSDPYNNGAYRHINEQVGFPHQTSGHRAKQNLPRRDIIADAEARRQAAEREARARNLRGNTRLPPDALPRGRQQPARQEEAVYEEQGDDELYEDEELYTRPPRSAVKYQPIESYLNGMKGANINYASPPPPNHKHAISPRRSAQYQQVIPPQRGKHEDTMRYEEEVYTEEIQEPRTHRRFRPQWLIFLGIAILLMIAGYEDFPEEERITLIRKKPFTPVTREDEEYEVSDLDTVPEAAKPQPHPVTSAMIGVLLLGMFVPLFCLAVQFYFILNPYTVTVTLYTRSQQEGVTGTLILGRVISPLTLSQSQTVPTTRPYSDTSPFQPRQPSSEAMAT